MKYVPIVDILLLIKSDLLPPPGYLPNGIHAVEAMLAAASIGAIWSSTSVDFGVNVRACYTVWGLHVYLHMFEFEQLPFNHTLFMIHWVSCSNKM